MIVDSDSSETECWIIASRPYPEKSADERFYLIREEAVEAWRGIDKKIRGSFHIYRAVLVVDKQPEGTTSHDKTRANREAGRVPR